jgi:hypothetical protein
MQKQINSEEKQEQNAPRYTAMEIVIKSMDSEEKNCYKATCKRKSPTRKIEWIWKKINNRNSTSPMLLTLSLL